MEVSRIPVDRGLIERVTELLLDGAASLRDAVKAQGVTIGQFNWYLQQDKEAAVAFARAMEFRADLLVDETISLADGTNDPAKVRNQIHVRHWAAERYNRRKYGERIDLNVTQTVDISGTLAEARARILRPVRDQLTHAEPETLDVPSRIVSRVDNGQLSPRDQEPPEAAGPLVPDIFS